MNNSQINLFGNSPVQDREEEPFANRFRPETIEDMCGQKAIIDKNSWLMKMIESDKILSMLLYGPPGTGKTTLARIIMKNPNYHTEYLNSVTCTVSIIREQANLARRREKKTLLFMDEIHRLNKGQQDVFLPFMEDGTFVLIGATTENPFFYMNRPLLSRLRLVKFVSLEDSDVFDILLSVDKKIQSEKENIPSFTEDALKILAWQSDGDGRSAINLYESCLISGRDCNVIDKDNVSQFLQERILHYDRNQDKHYDTISAMIKSIRGSDPDASVYWMAKMLESGEKPEFIARRLLILAAEDIGLADPQAMVVASACVQAFERVGMPEGRIILSELCLYLANAPKSNSAYQAINKAMKFVQEEKEVEVPIHLRSKGNKGKYLYPHQYPDHFVKQEYLPVNESFYSPCDSGEEKEMLKRLKKNWGVYPRK